jgi:predicted type IV restriction endonuclease
MDFKDLIKQLGERVVKLKDSIQTEEATKTAFVMPFMQALGYDIFNPTEVVPEFIADIGVKKGEKVDYAIFKDGIPVILVECKHHNANLSIHHDSQLLRYFHVSKAKFAILTNGIKYKFYTDLAEPNKMDEKPFFEFDSQDVKEQQIEELKKFHKSIFDVTNIVNAAGELKYTNEIKAILISELKNPTEAFIKYFVTQVYSGRVTEKVMFQFADLVKKSINQVISDMIQDRLQSALDKEKEVSAQAEQLAQPNLETQENAKEPIVETTKEELEGYFIIKSILRQKVEAQRITYRDAQSYFAIMLDDNNRKTICRLHFNSNSKKYVGLLDEAKKEVKQEIITLDDIFKFSDQLLATVDTYERLKS